MLLKQVKEKDKEVEKAAEVGHEQVEVSLLEKFDTMKAEEAEVQGTLIEIILLLYYTMWRQGGLMVSVLVSGSSCSGSSPG